MISLLLFVCLCVRGDGERVLNLLAFKGGSGKGG